MEDKEKEDLVKFVGSNFVSLRKQVMALHEAMEGLLAATSINKYRLDQIQPYTEEEKAEATKKVGKMLGKKKALAMEKLKEEDQKKKEEPKNAEIPMYKKYMLPL